MLRAALDWSYALLQEPDRRFFNRPRSRRDECGIGYSWVWRVALGSVAAPIPESRCGGLAWHQLGGDVPIDVEAGPGLDVHVAGVERIAAMRTTQFGVG